MGDIHRKSGLDWYSTVPEFENWESVFESNKGVPVPGDWIVYLSDVVGSTKAIEAGRYKDVNTAGCLPIMALANLFGNLDFPFVFGGDGVTVLLPPDSDETVTAILRDTKKMAKSIFELDLRLAKVPLSFLYEQGSTLALARCKLSDRYRQAVFFGDGIEAAEDLLKFDHAGNETDGRRWAIPELPGAPEMADFTGFSCRWQDIPSPHGITFAMVLKKGPVGNADWCAQVLAAVRDILGNEDSVHPLGIEQQKLAALGKSTRLETEVEMWNEHGFFTAVRKAFHRLGLRIMLSAAKIIMRLDIPVRQGMFQVNKRREENRASSDVRKFDGSLKLIASATSEKVKALISWLDGAEKSGKIVYGLHQSDRALMTCMVHVQSYGEVHFVDGADGGYTMAAKALKAKLKATAQA